MKNKYYLETDFIKGLIYSRYISINSFCKDYGISKVRFYAILRRGYKRKKSEAVTKLIDFLNVCDVSYDLFWKDK